MQLKPINQQVVAIVGASSGIGRDTALKFADRGAKLVVSARSESGLNSLVDEIRQKGGEAIAVIADVADFEQVKAIADKTVEHYGRLDTWVHASATSVFATFENTTPEEFKRVIEVNLLGQVYGAMAALPHLKREGRGSLIHVSSMEARRSLPFQSSYSSSKHGVNGFLDSLRLELQHEKLPINVTSIMPAVIDTPFYSTKRDKLDVKLTAIPPYYKASLVADAILYVAEHPTREFIVGDVGRMLDIAHRISPHLTDTILLLVGFPGQQLADKPKPEDAPDDLYEAYPGFDTVEGDLNKDWVIPSFTDWLDMNPTLKWGSLAAGILGLAMLAAQAFSNGEQV